MTEQEKEIYNTYLAISRGVQNKPFTLRKNFDSVTESNKLFCTTIAGILNRNKSIHYKDFFQAPYTVYGVDNQFNLQFYTTRKAIICYTQYMQLKELCNADSDSNIEDCKQKIIKVYSYCKEKQITLNQYRTYVDGVVPIALIHLKEHIINFYILHALNISIKVEQELLDMYITNFYDLLDKTRIKYVGSKKLKNIMSQMIFLLEKRLNSRQN